MRKVFLFIAVAVSLVSNSQTVPTVPAGISTQTFGSATTTVQSNGYFVAKKGFYFSYFADTTAANLTLVDQIAFSLIVTSDGSMWLRNLAKTAWIYRGSYTSGNATTVNGNGTIDAGGTWSAPIVINAPNSGARYMALIDTGTSAVAKLYVWGKQTDLSTSTLQVTTFGTGVGSIFPVASFTAPQVAATQFTSIRIGKSLNSANSDEGYVSHYYAGAASVNNSLVFSFGNNNRPLWVQSDNKVGINKQSPTSTLHVDGTVDLDNLPASPTDSTNYKPAVIDASGNLSKMQGWPIPAAGTGRSSRNPVAKSIELLSGFNCLGVPPDLEPGGLNTTKALVDNQIFFAPIYIDSAATVTGVRFYLSVAGDYTADNSNTIGLYSYSGGTLTLQRETASAESTYESAAGNWKNLAFASTYNAQPGLYFIGFLINYSAVVTAPELLAGTDNANNSVSFASVIPFRPYRPSSNTQPATANSTTVFTANSNTRIWAHLY